MPIAPFAAPVTLPPSSRRITPAMRETARRCALAPDAFPARGEVMSFLERHWRLLGLSRASRDFLLAAIRCTRPADWREGGQPRCWAHNDWFIEQLSVTESSLRRSIRALAEGGFLAPFDQPNCHRRAPGRGKLQERGFLDLTPIQHAWSDWWRKALEQQKTDAECTALREDIARSHFRLNVIAEEHGRSGAILEAIELMRKLMTQRRRLTSREALTALAVEAERLVVRIERETSPSEQGPCTAKTAGKTAVYDGHHTDSFKKESTRMARSAAPIRIEQCGVGQTVSPDEAASGLDRDHLAKRRDADRHKSDLPPAVLLRLCPPLRDYVSTGRPDLAACVDAAHALAQSLGIAQPIWAEACLTLGRYRTATALAILATRIAEGARVLSPGAYLLAQCRREERGELFLARSLQRLRYELQRRSPHTVPPTGEKP